MSARVMPRTLDELIADEELWLAERRAALNILTAYDPPPIPIRTSDWSAVTDNYSGEPSDPIGYGRTEAEAIADLIYSIEERS
jgi:hypothetical protein